MTKRKLNLPYHEALMPYCAEQEWNGLPQHEKLLVLRELGIKDLNVLIQCILWPTDGLRILPLKPFHVEMIKLYMSCIRWETNQREVLYLIPRGHLKTQLITTAGPVWALLNDPDEAILINSQHLDLATRITSTIRDVYRYNELFRSCYPEWCPAENQVRGWATQTQMTVCNREKQRKEPSIIAGSFDSPRTGDHFGIIHNDDPHNEKNISTIDQIQKVRDGWEAQGALDDGNLTRRIYVATRWHHQDVNDLIMQKCAPRFYKKFINKELLYNQPLLNIEPEDSMAVFLLAVWADADETETIWPEKKSVENVRKWKEEVGAYLFSCQMLNDPVPPEDQTFKQDDFRYYETVTELNEKGIPEQYYLCGEKKIGQDETGMPLFEYRKIPIRECVNQMTVDPAFGIKANNDYVGIVVAAHWIEPKSRMRWIIVLETVREHMTMSVSQALIEQLATRYGIHEVHIESIGCNSIYLEQMADHPKWGGAKNIRVVPVKRNEGNIQGKSRVTRLEPYYQSHRVWHAPQMRQGPLEQELMAFVGGMSRGAHDDLADAMSDHCEIGHRSRMPDYDPLGDVKSQTWGMRKGKGLYEEPKSINDRDVWRML